jgi:Tfp pilus assembly protein PilV
MVYMKIRDCRRITAMTLPEVLVALLLLGLFLPSVFAINSVCLRLVSATKESTAAVQVVHDRCETLRNLAYSDLTSSSYVQNLMVTAANGSDFCKNATEVVTMSAYPVASGVSQFTRSSNGSVTTNSVAASLGSTLVQVTISTSWSATFGGRARSEETTTIISNGTKK